MSVKTLPERKTINAAFTAEGGDVYELGQSFAKWLETAHPNITINSMRYDYSFQPEVKVEEKDKSEKDKKQVRKEDTKPAEAG